MSELVLHHYPLSPVAQKVRAILGYKQLPWRSVITPAVMPKPDLVALTGGYRKAPVLQIGCDIYCDSKLISRVLEQLHPTPALLPRGQEASAVIHEQWAEKFFLLAIPVVFQPAGARALFGEHWQAAVGQFQQDRAKLFAGGSAVPPTAEATQAELPGLLALIEAQLQGQDFIAGSAPTLADFSLYFPVWFIHSNAGVRAFLDPYPNLRRWCERLSAFEQAPASTLTGEEAIALARSATPVPLEERVSGLGELKRGDCVTVAATDYGTDPVAGELLHADELEVVLRREDPRAGTVRVHFPRSGFRVSPA